MGVEFARQLAAKGYNLLIVSNEERIHEVAKDLKTVSSERLSVIGLVMDLGKQSSARELYDYTKQNNIEVEVLVNNAGVYHDKDILDDSEGFTGLIMNLHMYTPAMLCYLSTKAARSSAVHQLFMLPSLSNRLPWSSKPWVISWPITTPMAP